jgi:hypothetical protein
MRTKSRLDTAVEAAQECARMAIDNAGDDPFDADGNCLMPREPLEGDLFHLDSILEYGPTPEEEGLFAVTYRDIMTEAVHEAQIRRWRRYDDAGA